MYQIEFTATNSADWAQALEITDASQHTCDGEPVIPDDATFNLTVSDRHGRRMFSGSTDDGRIQRPNPSTIQWVYERDELTSLCAGNTYNVGLTVTTDNGTTQILIGSLSFIDGIVRP